MSISEEVLRRAKIFRQQIPAQGPCPLLVLPDSGESGCISCGTAIDEGHYRCGVCAQAVQLAFEWAAHPEAQR